MPHLSPLTLFALVSAIAAAAVLVGCLALRPRLGSAFVGWLLLGLGVLPLGTAITGNIRNYETTKQRSFCASCHVMEPWVADAGNPKSQSLAARHSRNALFGDESCYVCHADYGLFGTVTTKIGGMRHVWEYYTHYRSLTLDAAIPSIRLYKPYSNDNCMQCHSSTNEIWERVPDHRSALPDVRSGKLGCASSGCHGYAHPVSERIVRGAR